MPKKTAKGRAGYVRYEKVKRGLITLLMFAIPITIYFTAMKITGTNRNIMTVVSILGIIPAARFAVSWIMIMMQKGTAPEIVARTEESAGSLVRGYELTVTAYEGRMPLDAVVICGNEIVCLSLRGDRKQFAFMEKHITKIMNSNNYFGCNVKILDDENRFFQRAAQLERNPAQFREGISFRPDEKYPDLSREELLFHTLMAISV